MPACPAAPSPRHGHPLNTEYASSQGQHEIDLDSAKSVSCEDTLSRLLHSSSGKQEELWAWEQVGLYPLTARRSYRRSDLHPFILVRLEGPRFFRGEIHQSRQVDINKGREQRKSDTIQHNQLGSILLLPWEATVSHTPQGTTSPFPIDHQGRDGTIKREASTCRVGAKMLTTEAYLSSLGKGLDWIRGTTPEDLGNSLVKE